MYCDYCGTPVSGYAKYCRNCGATLEYYKSEFFDRTASEQPEDAPLPESAPADAAPEQAQPASEQPLSEEASAPESC